MNKCTTRQKRHRPINFQSRISKKDKLVTELVHLTLSLKTIYRSPNTHLSEMATIRDRMFEIAKELEND